MPEPINADWKRVTYPTLKPYREWSTPASAVLAGHKVLDKPTHNLDGSLIPPKYTPESLAGTKSGGPAADTTKKENS